MATAALEPAGCPWVRPALPHSPPPPRWDRKWGGQANVPPPRNLHRQKLQGGRESEGESPRRRLGTSRWAGGPGPSAGKSGKWVRLGPGRGSGQRGRNRGTRGGGASSGTRRRAWKDICTRTRYFLALARWWGPKERQRDRAQETRGKRKQEAASGDPGTEQDLAGRQGDRQGTTRERTRLEGRAASVPGCHLWGPGEVAWEEGRQVCGIKDQGRGSGPQVPSTCSWVGQESTEDEAWRRGPEGCRVGVQVWA